MFRPKSKQLVNSQGYKFRPTEREAAILRFLYHHLIIRSTYVNDTKYSIYVALKPP